MRNSSNRNLKKFLILAQSYGIVHLLKHKRSNYEEVGWDGTISTYYPLNKNFIN